ncbi:protein PAF1 homolog [Malania oleifera]|uniref:protein PAF1 homolog n=1 Tax=Malania oleifera TaxID=397392 RepID=UPI0025AE5E43|nr:protein PAF1 homolog [Malania oleifera]
MASYRPYPSQSSFGGPQPPPLPHAQPPPPPPPRGTQYSQNWGYSSGDGSVPPGPPPPPPSSSSSSSFPQSYNQMHHPNSNFHHGAYGSSSSYAPAPPHHQQYSYRPPPPPPPESSYPPPPPQPSVSQNPISLQQPQPPAAPMYYSSSTQYSQFSHQPLQPPLQPPPPPPPPPSPPPSSSIPPPPPLSPPPVPPPSKDRGLDGGRFHDRDKGTAPKDLMAGSSRREPGPSNHGIFPLKQNKAPPVPPVPAKKSNGPPGRVETEEERRLRKKREFEKQRQEEKHRQQLKESQNTVLQKTQMLSSGMKGHGSIVGSRMGERRATPFLSGDRIENRLKKPTTFLCKMKFRNELPDPTAQPKLMTLKTDKDRFARYTITSLEKMHKPQLFVEPDLGIPLDLLDLSVYNPHSVRPPLAPEDEELLRDDESITPVKTNSIKRKERPTDKGVSWLVKTQYISPLSMEAAKQSLTEKQAKELRETRGGQNILENFNSRERKIQAIEASFVASKSRPVHSTNSKLQPVEILPLFPDFDRFEEQFIVAAFDSAPTADSEIYSKIDKPIRDAHEGKAIMKSFVATGSDPDKPEKFLAYMVPSLNELSKDLYDESEDISFSWVREYHWDVKGDDADDRATYLLSLEDGEARYVPLSTKLILRKKRAKEGRSSDEVEHYPAPASVTVRQRPTVSAIELKDSGVSSSSKGSVVHLKREGVDIEDGLGTPQKVARMQDMDQSSGAEDDMSY